MTKRCRIDPQGVSQEKNVGIILPFGLKIWAGLPAEAKIMGVVMQTGEAH